MRDKVTRQCPQTRTFEEKGDLKQIWTEVPLLTSLMPYHYAKPAHKCSVVVLLIVQARSFNDAWWYPHCSFAHSFHFFITFFGGGGGGQTISVCFLWVTGDVRWYLLSRNHTFQPVIRGSSKGSNCRMPLHLFSEAGIGLKQTLVPFSDWHRYIHLMKQA